MNITLKFLFILSVAYISLNATVDYVKLLSYQTPYSFLKEQKAHAFQAFLQTQHIDSKIASEVLPALNIHYTVEAVPSLSTSFMNPEAIKDFELEKLAKTVPTYTNCGHWGLYHLLCNPLTQLHDIQARAAALQTIASDAALEQHLRDKIKSINTQVLLDYWQPELNPLHAESNKLYFSHFFNNSFLKTFNLRKQSLNKNTAALSLANNCAFITATGRFILSLGLSGFITEAASYGMRKTIGDSASSWDTLQLFKSGILQPIHIHNPFPSLYKNRTVDQVSTYPLLEGSKLTMGDWYKYFYAKAQWFLTKTHFVDIAPENLEEWSEPFVTGRKTETNNLILNIPQEPSHQKVAAAAVSLTCAYIGMYDISMLLNLYSKGQEVSSLYSINTKLQAYMVNIANTFEQLRQLAELLHQDARLQALPGSQDLYTILITRNNNSVKLNELLDLLNSSTFTSKSAWHSKGVVLRTHKLLRSIKHELIPLFQALGKIDAALSLTNLYTQSKDSHATWCFPEFNNTQTQLYLEDFWNPHLSTVQAVTNTIALGNQVPRNAIFSGPNGGGKSTSQQAIGLIILLSQSWCIVPARVAHLSTFTHLRTYLAPQAQLDAGMSTFMAEKRLLDSIMATAETLSSEQRIFIILDEPLRGTIEREAAQRIFKVGLKLGEQSNCCAIIATHIEKPTELAQHTNQFANYHMELLETMDGFKRTFKLVPGAASWWFHDDVKRARFIDTSL